MKISSLLQVIDKQSQLYPNPVIKRLGEEAPNQLWAIGNIEFLSYSKTALFCSKKCPGDAILKAMEKAQEWRNQGRCIISGFHSPVEKECLNILLKGKQPIIICPARSIEKMRVLKEWTEGIKSERILILSQFDRTKHRVTAKQSEERNILVAAISNIRLGSCII
jgi:predicted Rossmann fold nucleotide-binding protein DprA/Smf involved in DNA uptake